MKGSRNYFHHMFVVGQPTDEQRKIQRKMVNIPQLVSQNLAYYPFWHITQSAVFSNATQQS